MTFDLDFALFYAYTLALFAFVSFWLVPQLARALFASRGRRPAKPSALPPRSPQRPVTRLEAFTRL